MWTVIVVPDHLKWHRHLVELLWMRDRPVADTSPWKQTTPTRGNHTCPLLDSYPQSQKAADARLCLRGHQDRQFYLCNAWFCTYRRCTHRRILLLCCTYLRTGVFKYQKHLTNLDETWHERFIVRVLNELYHIWNPIGENVFLKLVYIPSKSCGSSRTTWECGLFQLFW